METDSAGHMDQSGHAASGNDQSEDTLRSGDQDGEELAALSDVELRRLAKASRSGLKWLHKVFQETY